jgi:3-oxoacyl-[acyl-carrier protein] reductase
LNLNGRVALITGPAKGMGAAVTEAFAAEGAYLALVGRDHAAIEPVAKSVKAAGGRAIIIPCDLTVPQQCAAAAEKARAAYGGRIDILVNVAGGSGPIGKRGAFHIMRSVLPAMIDQRYGKIVNVGGTFGMRGRAGRMAYSASKWGLRGITKSFALEVGQYNINVNCVAPGMVDGPRFREKVCADMARRLNISVEEAAARHAADYALKRVTIDSDVAHACLFLASDVSRQITGVDLPVDGGWAMM